MAPKNRAALVTGANRGMGFETCRRLAALGMRVVLTARDSAKGKTAASKLRAEGHDVVFHRLDVTDPRHRREAATFVRERFGRLDVLVNNAAVYLDEGRSVLDVGVDVVRETLDTNLIGPLALCQAFVPLMRKNGYGRIVNVSSGYGQVSRGVGDEAPGYGLSKIGLNALTRMVAAAVAGENILVNAVDPGWVRTGMGGPQATRSVEQGVETTVWLATLADGGPSGGFFKDRREAAW